MFVEDFRKDFYDLLRGQRVLVLANFNDVDSLATVKIFQHLFYIDNIIHTLIPVCGYQDIKKHYADYDDVKKVILINCGGTIDLLHLLGTTPTDTIFFIIDNHRPFSLLNIYNETKQVRILGSADDEKLPSFDELFFDNTDQVSDESDEENEENTIPGSHQDARERRAEKRMKRIQREKLRREFEEKRSAAILHYSEYNYYGKPSCIIALTITTQLSRANSEVVWWAVVGSSDFLRLGKMDRTDYTVLISVLQQHVNIVSHANEKTLFNFKISMIDELDSCLYRCWSVYESMKVSLNWACMFKLWSVNGEQKLKLFLAECGLPLAEVKQDYEHMSPAIRNDLLASLKRKETKFELKDWTVGTFEAKYGYNYYFTALDIHLAIIGILNSSTTKMGITDKFIYGLSCLNKENHELIMDGTCAAKSMLTSIYNQVKYVLSLDQVIVYGSLLIANIATGRFDFRSNNRPSYLILLVRFIQNAYITNSRSNRYKNLPLMLVTPSSEDSFVAIGIPPFSVNFTHNLFGKVFEQVSSKMNGRISLDLFEPSICQFKAAEKDIFIENVVALMF